MRKSNDKVLSLMVQTARSVNVTSPARVALLQSLIYWIKHDFLHCDQKLFFFIHITMNPDYFVLPDFRIAQKLHLSPKCIQNYRKEFKQLFLRNFERLQKMDKTMLALIHSARIRELESLGFPSGLPSSPKNLTPCAPLFCFCLSKAHEP